MPWKPGVGKVALVCGAGSAGLRFIHCAIRSGRGEVDFDSTYWLTWLAAHPDQRYTSDGNPNTVSFPKSLSGELISPRSHQSNPY